MRCAASPTHCTPPTNPGPANCSAGAPNITRSLPSHRSIPVCPSPRPTSASVRAASGSSRANGRTAVTPRRSNSWMSATLFEKLLGARNRVFKNNTFAKSRRAKGRLRGMNPAPVSYTHLDVYKRQITNSPTTPHTTTRHLFMCLLRRNGNWLRILTDKPDKKSVLSV